MTIGKRVVYQGRVQGVGFRYTAQGLAENFPVAGFVRNLFDGSVEVVVEGEADQVKAFLDALARRMAAYIDSATVQEQTPQGLQGFTIRF
jgi:acylphosphatase